jgi:putative membrane protein
MAALSDYLAAERTFLAWLRTGLALMGFGFVVARFGLFLQQLQIVEHSPALHSSGLSLWLGTGLILAGIVVNGLSAWRHVRVVRQLDDDRMPSAGSLAQVISIAAFLALVGIAMAIYLLFVSGSSSIAK